MNPEQVESLKQYLSDHGVCKITGMFCAIGGNIYIKVSSIQPAFEVGHIHYLMKEAGFHIVDIILEQRDTVLIYEKNINHVNRSSITTEEYTENSVRN